VNPVKVGHEFGSQSQLQEAVGDRRFLGRSGGGFLAADVNPLVVARGVGKVVDVSLRDGLPRTDADFLAHALPEFGRVLKGFHMGLT